MPEEWQIPFPKRLKLDRTIHWHIFHHLKFRITNLVFPIWCMIFPISLIAWASRAFCPWNRSISKNSMIGIIVTYEILDHRAKIFPLNQDFSSCIANLLFWYQSTTTQPRERTRENWLGKTKNCVIVNNYNIYVGESKTRIGLQDAGDDMKSEEWIFVLFTQKLLIFLLTGWPRKKFAEIHSNDI